MKLLVDHNPSFRLARALHALVEPEHEVAALKDRFDRATPDAAWLAALGAEGGWAVLSGDVAIYRKLTLVEQTVRVFRLWERMTAQFDLVEGGALFELPQNAGSKLRQIRL